MKSTILMLAGLVACTGGDVSEADATAQGIDISGEMMRIEADTGVTEAAVVVAAEELIEPVAVTLPAVGASVSVEVQDGESLSLLASWSGVTAEDIAAASGITVTSRLMPGQEIAIPMDPMAAEGFEVRRQDAMAARVQRYLDRRGGELSIDQHTVRTGESAWSIARSAVGIPTWVLAFYNPGIDMDHLTIGQGLTVPLFTDTVADGAE
jgi:LysM repeat protein